MSCFSCCGSVKDEKPLKRSEIDDNKSTDDQEPPAASSNQLPDVPSGMFFFGYLLPQGFSELVRVNSILVLTDKVLAGFPFVQNLIQQRTCLVEILSEQETHQRIQLVSNQNFI